MWESFADAASTDVIGDDRYSTVMLGLAIDANRYYGDVPAELRAVAAVGFALLGIVERMKNAELNHKHVSFASVYELEQLLALNWIMLRDPSAFEARLPASLPWRST